MMSCEFTNLPKGVSIDSSGSHSNLHEAGGVNIKQTQDKEYTRPSRIRKSQRQTQGKETKLPSKKGKSQRFYFILQFKCKCPDVSEVRKLHPLIKDVFIPRRPASTTYCVLNFSSQETCNEVRNSLHGKHIGRYKAPLICRDTTKTTLVKLTGLSAEKLKKTFFSGLELKQMRRISKQPAAILPPSINHNSTCHELFVRYGMESYGLESGKKKNKSMKKMKRELRKLSKETMINLKTRQRPTKKPKKVQKSAN